MLKIENICLMSTYNIKTNMENWKKIQGFENYSISDMGRVRRDTPGPATKAGKILNSTKDGHGYFKIILGKNGEKRKKLKIHRLVAEHFLDEIQGKTWVNHIDGNPENNNVKNLEWVTPSENSIHAYKIGLSKPQISNTKLQICDVIEIRNLKKNGMKTKDIAVKFDLCSNSVSQIITKKTWSHI